MGDVKTKPNDDNVLDVIGSITDEQKRQDSLVLLEMFTSATGKSPKMWGSSIIGFGSYTLKSGDWPLVGFSPRKQTLTLYVIDDGTDLADLLAKLGKYKTSKVCLYINTLADVDLAILEQIISKAYQGALAKYSSIA